MSTLPQPPLPDSLNPLNLAPIKPLETSKASVFSSEKKVREDKLSPQPSLKLPLRLHLISNTSTENLLETRKCNLPCFMISQYQNPDFIGR